MSSVTMSKFRFICKISDSGPNQIIWIPRGFHDAIKKFKNKQVRVTIDDDF